MRASLIVITVACLFVGGLLLLIGGRPLLDAWQYRQAIRTEAAATGTAWRPATGTSDTEYEVSYRAAIDGRVYERTELAPVHVWERASIAARVPAEYLPGRPETVRVAIDHSADRRSIVFTAAGALIVLVGIVAAAAAIRWRPPNHARPSTAAPAVAPAYGESYWPRARQSPPFWLGAMFLVVATPFVVATLLQLLEEWRFARNGVSTDAVILTKEIKGSGRNPRSRGYEVTYRVTVPEGAFENRARLSLDAWSRLQERRPAEVLYLPERPASNRLAGSGGWMQPIVLGVLGFGCFGVGAAFLRRSIGQARLEWRLERRGAAATGMVVEICDRRLAINGVRQWRLSYEYDDFQARRHTGTHDLPEEEAQLWRVGDVGEVRYDPGKPGDAIWLGRPA